MMADDEEPIPPQVLVLGSLGCGKSTLLHALSHGCVPAPRQLRRHDGCTVHVVLCDLHAADGEAAEDPARLTSVAFVEVNAADHGPARSFYHDEAEGVLLLFEAGRAGSWRWVLDALSTFASTKLKRRLQHNEANRHAAGQPRVSAEADFTAAADRVRADLSRLPLLLAASKCDAEGSAGAGGAPRTPHPGASGFAPRTAALKHSSDWLEVVASAVLDACRCQARWAGVPQPRNPPPVHAGSTTRTKLTIPLQLPQGFTPAWWGKDGRGRVGCGLRLPTRVAVVEALVAGVACAPRVEGEEKGGGGDDASAACWVARAGANAPVGVLAPVDAIEGFIRDAVQVRHGSSEGRPGGGRRRVLGDGASV